MFNRNLFIFCFLIQVTFSFRHEMSDSERRIHIKSILEEGSEAEKERNILSGLDMQNLIEFQKKVNAGKDTEVVCLQHKITSLVLIS